MAIYNKIFHFSRRHVSLHIRCMTTAAASSTSTNTSTTTTTTHKPKKEGDISSVFVSLSNTAASPLPPRFASLKRRLISGHEAAVSASWDRLLATLAQEIPLIAAAGPSIVPEIDFDQLDDPPESFVSEHRKRGVAVIRNVVPEEEALHYKTDLRDYIAANPQTRAFPPDNPQVYELYWSSSQVRARAHPNVLKAQRFLMGFWHSTNPSAGVSTQHPMSYADRLRIRMPGDNRFALGPHVDGGSVERWEEEGYGLGGVYNKVFQGRWEEYDPFEASCRLPVQSDLYNGAGACSMFRMYQGWLSMSKTGPGEGTLLVNPLLGLATAYYLLRPFFKPTKSQSASMTTADASFLSPTNWTLELDPTSTIQGAFPGHCQEFTPTLHPHLSLPTSMVHVPQVAPGDYVAWHCDTIHAVDSVHAGATDSSVLYIPSCPLTEQNAQYLARQREAFVAGTPGPDFPGGQGESKHVGRPGPEATMEMARLEGSRSFGLEAWDSAAEGLSDGQREVLDRANKILGFYD